MKLLICFLLLMACAHADPLPLGQASFVIDSAGVRIGWVRCTVTRHGELYRIRSTASLAGYAQGDETTVHHRTFVNGPYSMFYQKARAAGVPYIGFMDGDPSRSIVSGQVGPARWTLRRPSLAQEAVLAGELSPMVYYAMARRLKLGEAITAWLPHKRITAKTTLVSRSDRQALFDCEKLAIRLTWDEQGPLSLEIPAQKLEVRRAVVLEADLTWPTRDKVTLTVDAKPRPLLGKEFPVEAVARDGAKLRGTLTVPRGMGPFPAVLIVCGSGDNNRDGIYAGISVYRDLARDLAARGVASVRYDKRGVGGSERGKLKKTVETFASDAASMLKVMRRRPEIDARRLHLAGHSEGSLVCLLVAAEEKVASVISLAGAAESIDIVVQKQVAFQMRKLGQDQKTIDAAVFNLGVQCKAAQSGLAGSFLGIPSEYWQSACRLDPLEAVRKSRTPLLIIQGEEDIQVLPEAAEMLEKAARSAGLEVRRVMFAGITHNLLRPGFATVGEEVELPLHPDAKVIDTVVDWIKARPSRKTNRTDLHGPVET